MKKGSYTDWSISVGIFIIYIISVFILLAPSFKYDYSPEYLGSIVKQGLEENTTLEIKRAPLFLKITLDGSENINTKYKFEMHDNIPPELQGLDNNGKQILILNNESQELTTSNQPYYWANPLGITLYDINLEELGVVSGDSGEKLVKLWVFSSEKQIFESYIPPTQVPFNAFKYTYGVAESLEGIYEPDFNEFTTKGYSEAKEVLNYPKNKDFSILIFNQTLINETPLFNYTKKIPDEKDKVNILLWSTQTIDNTTKTNPVTVLIKTW